MYGKFRAKRKSEPGPGFSRSHCTTDRESYPDLGYNVDCTSKYYTVPHSCSSSALEIFRTGWQAYCSERGGPASQHCQTGCLTIIDSYDVSTIYPGRRLNLPRTHDKTASSGYRTQQCAWEWQEKAVRHAPDPENRQPSTGQAFVLCLQIGMQRKFVHAAALGNRQSCCH